MKEGVQPDLNTTTIKAYRGYVGQIAWTSNRG
jgi:hypothetical protein